MGGSELRLLTPDPLDPGNPLDPGMNSKPTIPFGAVLQKLPLGFPGRPISKDFLERGHKGPPGGSEGASRVLQGAKRDPQAAQGELQGCAKAPKRAKLVPWKAQRGAPRVFQSAKKSQTQHLGGTNGPRIAQSNPMASQREFKRDLYTSKLPINRTMRPICYNNSDQNKICAR